MSSLAVHLEKFIDILLTYNTYTQTRKPSSSYNFLHLVEGN